MSSLASWLSTRDIGYRCWIPEAVGREGRGGRIHINKAATLNLDYLRCYLLDVDCSGLVKCLSDINHLYLQPTISPLCVPAWGSTSDPITVTTNLPSHGLSCLTSLPPVDRFPWTISIARYYQYTGIYSDIFSLQYVFCTCLSEQVC